MGNIHTVGPNEALIVSGKPMFLINKYVTIFDTYVLVSIIICRLIKRSKTF